jgi:Family of unknown function (DUF6076)
MDRRNLTIGSVHAMLDFVMHGEIAYRQMVLSERGVEKLRLPLLAPANDMLGWANQREGYLVYLHDRYGGVFGSLKESVPFADAAKSAVGGRLAASLGPLLERLRFAEDGNVIDIPDFPALAAWSLLEGVRRLDLRLRSCSECHRPWLAAREEASRYCQRWAPGHLRDCRTLAAERRLAGDKSYARYRREYKRITEMERRGTIEIADLYRWRDANDATNWSPFEEWKEHHDG